MMGSIVANDNTNDNYMVLVVENGTVEDWTGGDRTSKVKLLEGILLLRVVSVGIVQPIITLLLLIITINILTMSRGNVSKDRTSVGSVAKYRTSKVTAVKGVKMEEGHN